jgi:hypothetical protein
LRGVDKSPGLKGKIAAALDRYPCDLLFVHRDAESSERTVYQQRRDEIRQAMESHSIPYVCVVPVRMTEAWLLIDADAIRNAVDNPASKAQIDRPAGSDQRPEATLARSPDPGIREDRQATEQVSQRVDAAPGSRGGVDQRLLPS